MTGHLPHALGAAAAAFVVATLVAGCAWIDRLADDTPPAAVAGGEDGIGGTGIGGGEDGIGGTGIVGTITAFGSIIVNGLRVDYGPDVPVHSVYGRHGPEVLAVGQVVAVEADSQAGRLMARTVDIRYPVTGPVERIDRAAGELIVLGQRVGVSEETFAGSGGRGVAAVLDRLKVGDMIDVSGLRAGDRIEASRVTPRYRDGIASLLGPVTATGPDGIAVGGQRLAFDGGSPSGVAVGETVQVTAIDQDARFRVRSLRRLPAVPFDGRMRTLSIEGFVAPADAGGGIRLDGVAVDPATPAGLRLRPGERVILSGDLDARGQVVPQRVERVRRLLPGMTAPGSGGTRSTLRRPVPGHRDPARVPTLERTKPADRHVLRKKRSTRPDTRDR